MRSILLPGEQRNPRTEFQQATQQHRVFLFHTLDKGKADAKPGTDVSSMQRLCSEELESSGELCTIEASGVSEVSVLSTLRSDTWLGSIPSFFIRVMNVVRLSPRRADLAGKSDEPSVDKNPYSSWSAPRFGTGA